MIAEADELLPIGEVARQTGVSLSAIRYYETLGLVSPVARQNAGFTLEEIGELLDERAGTRERRHALVRSKLAEVQRSIRRLQGVAAALEEALTCGCDSLEHCPMLP